MHTKLPQVILYAIGIVCIALAGIGLGFNMFVFYNMQMTSHVFSEPFFWQSYYVLTVISVAINGILAFCGYHFLKRNFHAFWGLLIASLSVYSVVNTVGGLWLHPKYGMSIAAASGVSLSGIMPHYMSYFYIWGPLLVVMAYAYQRNYNQSAP